MSETWTQPYAGTITDGKTYAKAHSITSNVRNIKFKPWLSGSDWQVCTLKKFSGDGYLFKKRGWEKFFHLSIYPSPSAFDEMERQHLNPRTFVDGPVSVIKCDCGKSFRPANPSQIECVNCIIKASNTLKEQLEDSKAKEKAHRDQLVEFEEKINSLKRSHNELQQSHQALAKDCLESRRNLKLARLEANRMAKKVIKHTKAKQKDNQHLASASRIMREMASVTRKITDVHCQSIEIEKREKQLLALASSIDKKATTLGSQVSTIMTSNSNILNLLRNSIFEDIKRRFRTVFGTIKPNRNVRLNLIENSLREYPKNFEAVIINLGIPFNKKMSLEHFSKVIKQLYDTKKDFIMPFDCYGAYTNAETEQMSIMHLSGNDIYYLISSESPTPIQIEKRIDENMLSSWLRISTQHLRNMVTKHMFENNLLDVFKRVTHVKLTLKKVTQSIILQMTLFVQTYRLNNGKMVLDSTI